MTKKRIFISYKTGSDDALSFQANAIFKLLKDHYDVWMDTEKLEAGKDWNTSIYDEIARTDVLLLLLSGKSAASDWVRREIDVARGAKASILPVLVRDAEQATAALDKFDLGRVQYVDFRTGSEAETQELFSAIETIKDEAHFKRMRWLADIRRQEVQSFSLARNEKCHAAFALRERAHETKILLATGDMSRLRDIDVLVNTENSYMQMARMFEGGTVSAALRREGAFISGSVEDTVQMDLIEQITRADSRYSVPLMLTRVVPTRAGHPESRLARRGIRYIFHASAVLVDPLLDPTRPIRPIDNPRGIQETVINVLEMAEEVDRARGIISPPGSTARDTEEAAADGYQPIRSLCLPIFGTGHGGRSVPEVIPDILHGIRLYLLDNPGPLNLRRVHVCVYNQADISLLRAEMRRLFEPVDPDTVDCG
ncbi:MAG: TIR domain-containing protein [Chloroflexota bacterium]